MDCIPPGSSVHGIFQIRILEWAAISYSRGSPRPRDRTGISCASPALAGGFFNTAQPGKPRWKSKKRTVCACVYVCVCVCVYSVVSDSLWPHELWPARLFCPWDFPGKNTGMGCHFLLQEIFQIQRLNPHLLCLLQWQADSSPLHYIHTFAFSKISYSWNNRLCSLFRLVTFT